MQGIDGYIEFDSQEELEEYFEWSKGFTMTQEDVDQGLKGIDAEHVDYPLQLDITLTGQTVKKLAAKNPKKTVELNKRVVSDSGDGE